MNYKLSPEEKKEAIKFSREIVSYIEKQISDLDSKYPLLDPYSKESGRFDEDKFIAVLKEIGHNLNYF